MVYLGFLYGAGAKVPTTPLRFSAGLLKNQVSEHVYMKIFKTTGDCVRSTKISKNTRRKKDALGSRDPARELDLYDQPFVFR